MTEVISERARYVPGGALAGRVACFDGYRERGGVPGRHLGTPSPFLTMIVTLEEPMRLARPAEPDRGPRSFDTLLGGLHATPVQIVHDGHQSGVQLSIDPLAARALFGLPAGELAAHDLRAESVIGRDADELHERIGEADDWPARFAALEAVLTRRMSRVEPARMEVPDPLRVAWTRLRLSCGAVPVAALAREVGWSERQLEKVFAREIGMSPKQVARVIRFDRARRVLQERWSALARSRGAETGAGGGRTSGLDMARLAADFGYHDQSHLIRDFRAFTGLAPTAWLLQEFGNVQVEALAHA